MEYILVVIANYLIGSIPVAYITARKLKGINLFEYGSGNIGATNAFRALGTGPGVFVFALDMLKGVAGVQLAKMAGGPWFIILAALVVIIGHNYSIFLKFRGGRGVAAGAGIILSLSPIVLLLALALFGIIVVGTKYVSLGSIVAAFSVPVLMIVFNQPTPTIILGIAAAAFVIYRHKPNIKRLLAGTESKIGSGNK